MLVLLLQACIWELTDEWTLGPPKTTFENHAGSLVRGVAWAPSIGLTTSMIATCGQDGKVFIHSESQGAEWETIQLNPDAKEDIPVWSVSWSQTGGMLACSNAENKVSIWKQALTGKWEMISDINQ